MTSPKLKFIPARHPLQRVDEDLRKRLIDAQESRLDRVFPAASDLCSAVFEDLKLGLPVPEWLSDESPANLGDKEFLELYKTFKDYLGDAGTEGEVAHLHAINIAQRIHLLRAFSKPDDIIRQVTSKVIGIVSTFPRSAEDIERGRNPGDVLDPYILTAAQVLLYQGNFEKAIGATVAHKALMIIEGLMGHLHEDIIGEMRGNVRAPEPRGFNQEFIDPFTNPFPGADVVQPPSQAGERIRFHQVKSKTGSAKGGDGKRLGQQLRTLSQYYDADVFYDALIGTTLRGHRSMSAVLTTEPNAVVLVGEAAFYELTRSKVGPELLLRVYQNAFAEAARQTGYEINAMAVSIVLTFRERADAVGEGFLEMVLKSSIGGPAEDQDSRLFVRPRAKRQ